MDRDAFSRNNTHAITGIHSGALNVRRIALVSGIIRMAMKRAYHAPVPLTARSTCRPIFWVFTDAHPPRSAIGRVSTKQIRFWKSRTTAVDVSSSVAFTNALITAVQKNDSELR